MSTLFTKIVRGELPSHKVWEDEHHLAFLDIRPVRPGHTLVIPKREVDYLFDLEPQEYTEFWQAVRTVEARLRERLGFARTVVVTIGWEVPHVHVHLIPTDSISDVPMPPHVEMTQEELAELARKLRD
ncbi:MAG: HIT family protein [Planctomycetota bacterium]|jgi:histidine triad (HIT) family protein|nr:HIT family protein [Planctomycetota bacterium]MDP6762018.1 HIT family protein [Planctomycetota bacterium]MDP6990671.1 HIT family protein [Planctomycetota bacterium]